MIVVLSRVLKISKTTSERRLQVHFHFRGVYKGYFIREIVLTLEQESPFVQGEDYLLLVHKVEVDNGILQARLLKFREV